MLFVLFYQQGEAKSAELIVHAIANSPDFLALTHIEASCYLFILVEAEAAAFIFSDYSWTDVSLLFSADLENKLWHHPFIKSSYLCLFFSGNSSG